MAHPDNINFQDFLNQAITRLSQIDGRVVNEEMKTGGMKLSKDEREAYLQMLADKLKDEGKIDLSLVPSEYKIAEDDVYRKVAQNEAKRIFE